MEKTRKRFKRKVNKYRVPVESKEREVKTHIDYYDLAEIKHPLFTKKYLYALLPMIEGLEFVSSAYIANNGLLRVNLKNHPEGYSNDIAVHCDKNKIYILRSQREDYNSMEDEIIEKVRGHTEYITKAMDKGDMFHKKRLEEIQNKFKN